MKSFDASNALFIKNGENPFIILTFPNKKAYRYSGFDMTEFLMMEKNFRLTPGKLVAYLKSKSYINCNHTQLTTVRDRGVDFESLPPLESRYSKPIYQVKKEGSIDIHFSDDGEETICGKEVNNEWEILTNHFEENSVNCIHCINKREGRKS